LRTELVRHDPALARRAEVVAVSKADLAEAAPARDALVAAGIDALLLSAVTGAGIDQVMHALADVVAESERDAPETEGFVLHRPAPPGFEVHHDGERWVVTGRLAERAVAFDDLTRPETAGAAAARLARAGVDAALRRLGARPGDEVRIGDLVFEFSEDGAAPEPG
jgi:GTP-binding protein